MIAPLTTKPALLIVKKRFFNAFASGEKSTEFRRHRAPFTKRVYFPGRWVRIAYNYDVRRSPSLVAQVIRFDVALAGDHPEAEALRSVYPDLPDDAEIAAIALSILRS
jgi:hypothetical protein